MRPFTLLLKPAGADCNLRCAYCFYLPTAVLYPAPGRHRMTPHVLERVVATYLAVDQPQHGFCWQGGEPTLMGLDFFRQVTALQQRHGRAGQVVANSLQTNATLLDDDWCAHLARYRFLVGVSIDGPPPLHDRFRVRAGGGPSHDRVRRGLQALQRHDVAVNALVLVSAANVAHAREVHAYLLDLGLAHQQYIPCADRGPDGALLPHAITGAEWGEFLDDLYGAWRADPLGSVIRNFEDVLAVLLGAPAVCTLARDCRQYLVVEHNGDLYPCDFHVQPEMRLGNVLETTWEAALASPPYVAFGRRKREWGPVCDACECLDLCAGDCPRHRVEPAAGTAPSHLCAGWREFLRRRRPELERIADALDAGR